MIKIEVEAVVQSDGKSGKKEFKGVNSVNMCCSLFVKVLVTLL